MGSVFILLFLLADLFFNLANNSDVLFSLFSLKTDYMTFSVPKIVWLTRNFTLAIEIENCFCNNDYMADMGTLPTLVCIVYTGIQRHRVSYLSNVMCVCFSCAATLVRASVKRNLFNASQ